LGFLRKYFPATSVIRHSLQDGGESRFYPDGIENGYRIYRWLGALSSPLRYVGEVLFNFLILSNGNSKVVLAIDPLCAFVPLVLKQIGIVRSVIFITPDFSERRFKNSLLNWIYYQIDEFCTKRADINLCVSNLIIERKIQLYSVIPDNFFRLPNIPDPDSIAQFSLDKKLPCSFVFVGNISSQIDFSVTIEIVKKMQAYWPEASLHVVGGGDYLNGLELLVAAEGVNNVKFYGVLNHTETLAVISQCVFGVALYNGTLSYDKYRDSSKIREYQALSCIPITTSVVQSNADEIRHFGSGLIIEDMNLVVKQLIEITKNASKAEELRENCQRNFKSFSHKFEEYRELMTAFLVAADKN
jgi:glycosyltransferase involved in cell wall biosynthesis